MADQEPAQKLVVPAGWVPGWLVCVLLARPYAPERQPSWEVVAQVVVREPEERPVAEPVQVHLEGALVHPVVAQEQEVQAGAAELVVVPVASCSVAVDPHEWWALVSWVADRDYADH